ncbi:hypothetical protein FACS189496_5340 [Bacilli bacterium]|nr:hypothetical protein FACS189496_5340 [Bacilli bacterium]
MIKQIERTTNTLRSVEAENRQFVKAVSEIQYKLNAPKNNTNKFGGYKYRSCSDILAAVKPLLFNNTIYSNMMITLNDELVLIGERYYVKATATLTNGISVKSASAYAREELAKKGMDGSQVTGTASSYARKYALNALFAIDDTDDADTDAYAYKTGADQETKSVAKKTYPTPQDCEPSPEDYLNPEDVM